MKFILDTFYLGVIRLHSENQSSSFNDWQAIPTSVTRITASDKVMTRACTPSNCALSKRRTVPSDGVKRPSLEKVLGNFVNASFFWMTSSLDLPMSETIPLMMPMILAVSSSETLKTS